MANKAQNYNENFLGVQQQTKTIDSSRKHQTKKQIFGEIKNVIHNQGIATPLKQDQQASKVTSSKFFSSDHVKNTQIKNEPKTQSNLKTKEKKSACNTSMNEIIFLDYFDFRGQCCSKSSKSDQQIWSEMNLFDDSFLNKITDFDQQPQNEDIFCETPSTKENYSDPEFFNNIKDEFHTNYWPYINDFEGDIDLYLENPLN